MKKVDIEGKTIKITVTVDAIGLLCPMPVVKLKVGLDKIAKGDVIELLADDIGMPEDVPAWCEETHNKFLSVQTNKEGIFVAYVEKNNE